MPTNNETRKAIEFLIVKYQNGEGSGRTLSCPLCKINAVTLWDKEGCVSCPNYAFKTRIQSQVPCVGRADKFPNLDWEEENHQLESFWTLVLDSIPPTNDPYIVNKKSILNIAKKFKS